MANILSPILIVRLSDLFCGNGLDPDHVAKEFHEEAVQIGLGPLRMQEENPLHVTGRGGERGSVHNAHPRKVIYLRVLTTKPLEDRKFQFVYICSLLSNKQFIRKQNG